MPLYQNSNKQSLTDGINTVSIKPPSTSAVATDISLVVQVSPNSVIQNNQVQISGNPITSGQGATTNGTQRVVIALDQSALAINQNLVAGSAITVGNGITTANTPRVVIASDNSSLLSNITQVSSVANPTTLPLLTVAGLPVRQVPDINGNTNIISSTQVTALFAKLSDGVTAIPTILANTSVPLTSATLPVQISGNSPMISPLAPSTVATRHEIVGAQFLTTPPVLTNLQQAPLRLNADGSLATGEIVKTVTQFGGFGVADVPVTGSIKSMSATNTTATFVYLQIHSTASALTTGLVPLSGKSYRIPANSTVFFGAGDLGTSLITNCRIGLSTSFNTYTPVALTATSFGVNIETI
jgi:hypothetical protein